MTDFPNNSQRPRKALRGEPVTEPVEKSKVEKVVEGEVVFRKKPLGRRFRETFIAEDGMTIREYVTNDILLPALRDLIYDVSIGSVERALFRDGRSVGRRGVRGGLMGPGGIRYDLASRGGSTRREDPQIGRRSRAAHDSDEVILPTRADAEAVLAGMFDILDRYESVKVSDFLELVGKSSNYTDERYGWTDLRGSRAVRTRHGYLLDLPRTEVLER